MMNWYYAIPTFRIKIFTPKFNIASLFVIINTVVDLAYALVDPRIRTR